MTLPKPWTAPVVVLSHIDGTRLDPYVNPPQVVSEALAPLTRARIPVVLFSSRTRAELERIREQLDLPHPFVAENGGAVFVPHGYFGDDLPRSQHVAGYQAWVYGKPYSNVVATLRQTAQRLGLGVRGFADMSVEEVAAGCGMSMLQARLAKLREYDEPFHLVEFDVGARRRLFKGLRAARLQCLQGDRFDHVGSAVDQGAIVDLILAFYRRAFGNLVSVGIGDAERHDALLQRVDLPIARGPRGARAEPSAVSDALIADYGLSDHASAIRVVLESVGDHGAPWQAPMTS